MTARALHDARLRTGLSVRELWMAYVGVGGDRDLASMRSYLDGASEPAREDYNLIVDALNERFSDLGLDRPLSYRRRR